MAPNTRSGPGERDFGRLTAGNFSRQISELEHDKLVTKITERQSPRNKVTGEKKEILYDGQLLDVTHWIDKHPGGGIIQFYANSGEDATLAIQQFHARSFNKVMAIMKQFKKRPAQIYDLDVMDEATLKKRGEMTKDFVNLYRELELERFFEPCYFHVTYRILELVFLFVTAGYLLLQPDKSFFTTFIGILLFAMLGARSGYLGHEGGHKSLTGDPKIDNLIQTITFGLGAGLSGACWNSQHNRHHDMPQRLHRDHDLRTLPLMAFNKKVLDDSKTRENFLVQHQAALSLSVDTFVVLLFWKFWSHPLYALKKEKWVELLCMCVHLLYVSVCIGFWPYVFSLYLGSIYLFGNYVLSHSHLPVTEGPLHWVEYALVHTQDIHDHWFTNWFMGYLNCQIEHHFFPTMPQFRNRLAKSRVQKLAAKHGIPYLCHSYKDIVLECWRNLQRVAEHMKEHDH